MVTVSRRRIGLITHPSISPPPPFSPSLISLMVSVDVKHHVYFIGHNSVLCQSHVMVYVGNAGMPLPLLLPPQCRPGSPFTGNGTDPAAHCTPAAAISDQ